MNELDQALENYLKDETAQEPYYDLILKTDFYIPLSSENLDTSVEQQESVSPLILKSEGKHYMMLFDSEERLKAWANQPIDYVILTGERAALVTTPQLHWALNIGSSRSKEFVPEEISWLKEKANAPA